MDFELTDDEIEELKRITHEEAITDTEWYIDRLCPKVAKAAQRKLVEWLTTPCGDHYQAKLTISADCMKCWQELRKGVGLE